MYTYYSTFGGSAGFGFNLQSDLTTDDDEKRRKINRFLPTTTTIVWYCFSYDGKNPEIIRRIISNDAGNFIELQYFSIKRRAKSFHLISIRRRRRKFRFQLKKKKQRHQPKEATTNNERVGIAQNSSQCPVYAAVCVCKEK